MSRTSQPHRKLVSCAAAATTLGLVLVACGGDDTVFTTNGANDLRKACEVRQTWSRGKSVECLECISAAPIPSCECTVKQAFVGLCAQQLKLKLATPECDNLLGRCVNSCNQADCGCIETCYSSRATCKARAAALEGCVAEVCAPHCR